MKRVGIVALAVLALVAAGCSRTKIIPQDQAHMGGDNFVQQAVKVAAGKPIKFIDDPSGSPHVLVIGTNGTWQPNANAPSQLNNNTGLNISPGNEIDVVFPTAGTYTVTCKVHPAMLLTVTVNP